MSLLLSTRYTCDQCGRSYKHKTNLCNHKREECGKPPSYFCPVCRKGFKKKQHLQRHLVVHQESEFINANVDQETLKSLMTNSSSSHHGVPKIENMVIYPSLPPLSTFPNPVFRMPYVNEASAYLSMMSNRMVNKDQQEGSYLGGMMGSTAVEQPQGSAYYGGMVVERIQPKQDQQDDFLPLLNYKRYDLTGNDIRLNSNMLYSCPRCPKMYKGKYTLARHLRLECGKSPTNRCEVCGQMFIHKHRLISHIKSLHNEYFSGETADTKLKFNWTM
ncbi:unnamed protein product [Callosobruchus maculatus]|uniref:C2H2-type domain-containing protein n=1 Tax=Callosobruchus maculatus TaxID=64391 RepID=A0A653BSA6_CALMS|nr:unnamed protein product [Callosobruchus maculatus]